MQPGNPAGRLTPIAVACISPDLGQVDRPPPPHSAKVTDLSGKQQNIEIVLKRTYCTQKLLAILTFLDEFDIFMIRSMNYIGYFNLA